jgi:hypothetical protein
VLGLNPRGACQIGNGSRDFQDTVVSASAQTEIAHRLIQNIQARSRWLMLLLSPGSSDLSVQWRALPHEYRSDPAKDRISGSGTSALEPVCSGIRAADRHDDRKGTDSLQQQA